jgi:hypothetical protein
MRATLRDLVLCLTVLAILGVFVAVVAGGAVLAQVLSARLLGRWGLLGLALFGWYLPYWVLCSGAGAALTHGRPYDWRIQVLSTVVVPALLAAATVAGIDYHWQGEIADLVHEGSGRVGGLIVTLLTLGGVLALLLNRAPGPDGPLDPNNSGPLSQDEPED